MFANRRGNDHNRFGGHNRPSPNGVGGGGTVSVLGMRVKKKTAVALTGFAGAVALLGPDLPVLSSIRRALEETYATPCVRNVMVDSVEDAVLMPPIPQREDGYIPTHIQLCYEWLRRDALNVDDATAPKEYIMEHRDVCLDWSAPHYAMLELISSTIVQAMTPRWRYVHRCSQHREHDELLRGYDWTPIQAVFSEAAMNPEHTEVVDPELFKEQCKACLQEYTSASDASRIRAKSLHHCLAFPPDSSLYKTPIALSPVTEVTSVPLPVSAGGNGNIAPISSVVNPVRARLNHAAQEWANVTNAPPLEPVSGTVILIDPNTRGVDPTLISDLVPPTTTSITIMSNPTCYTTHLPTGQLCKEYAEELVGVLEPLFPNLVDTGYDGGPGIKIEFPASSAALMSRPILANKLICPPDTLSCLLPAMAKKPPTSADVGDGICNPPCPGAGEGPTKFFDKVGTNGNVDVKQFPEDPLRPFTAGTPDHPDPIIIPPTGPGFLPSEVFPQMQTPTAGDSFPVDGPFPNPSQDPQTVSDTPSLTAYKSVEPELPPPVQAASTGNPNEPSPIAQAPNVVEPGSDYEKPVTPEQVDAAIANEEPILTNTNTYDPEADPTDVTPPEDQIELEGEENNALVQRDLTDLDYEQAAAERKESTKRVVKGADGAFHYEVPCPTVTGGGQTVETDDGVVLTTTESGDTIASTGSGTVGFTGSVTLSTVETKPAEVTRPDGTTEVVETIEVEDILTGENITIPATGAIQQNPDSSFSTVGNELSSLTINEQTGECVLITEGTSKGNRGQGKGGGESNTKTVISGTCSTAGNENQELTEDGTLTMNEEGTGLEVTQKVDEPPEEFVDTNPDGGNTMYLQMNNLDSDEPRVSQVTNIPDNCLRYYDRKGAPLAATDLPKNPFHIVNTATDGSWVEFDAHQIYKMDTISWMALAFKDYDCGSNVGGEEYCVKINEVGPTATGPADRSPRYQCGGQGGQPGTYYPRRRAWCNDGQAIVDVFLHDGSKSFGQMAQTDATKQVDGVTYAANGFPTSVRGPDGTPHNVEDTVDPNNWITKYIDAAHPQCEASQDVDNKCWYRYAIQCGGARRRLASTDTNTQGAGGAGGLLRGLVPHGVVPAQPKAESRILFAKSIIEKCPELAPHSGPFHNFVFGRDVNNNKGATMMQ